MVTINGTKQREETLGLIAAAWMAAETGETITIVQPNERGGKSLEKQLKNHFPGALCESRDKSRIITLTRNETDPAIIGEWAEHTKLRLVGETGFYSMPGLFGWDRIDTGSALLVRVLPPLSGTGADFGCGYGYLAKTILAGNPDIRSLYGLDNDERAIAACNRNVGDRRAVIQKADCTRPVNGLPPLDFIVMNPPFHDATGEDHGMGKDFIAAAAHHLKPGGVLYLVANRHLPYEKTLAAHFGKARKIIEEQGFKIFEAIR